MSEPNSYIHPSADMTVEMLRHESRGHLKIFLGAAPGVGKTFVMLHAARSRKAEGADIIIGIVETHGRPETNALVEGIEAVPSKTITYRGLDFQELDIDAVLARKPQLAIIDELAHTNIPGSRHPKRYQDIEELLNAGIDVYTTLNIQHVESLNDIVTRITNVKIRETVPDSILEIADEIELIDLPPKDLQRRLKAGKVYVPEQAKRAESHFFSQGNLTALRELALRYTAERVDRQMLAYMRARGIEEIWHTRDRLMVCIDDSPGALELVRSCSRIAERQKVLWIAVYVENLLQLHKDKHYISQAMLLVEELGGEACILSGENAVKQIINLANSRHVTRIIVGKPKAKWWRLFSPSVAHQLLKQTETIELLMIPTDDIVVLERQFEDKLMPKSSWLFDYVIATYATFMAGLAAYGVNGIVDLPNLSLIFLPAVLYVALRSGFWPSVYTTIFSIFVYDFFFMEPLFTLDGFHEEYILTSLLFVMAAGITSRLAGQVYSQIDLVKQNNALTINLFEFSQKVASAGDLQSVLHAIVHHVGVTLDKKTLVMLPEEGKLAIVAGYPNMDELSYGAAEWTWRHGEPAGHFCNTLPASPWIFIPMRTESGRIGILGVYFADAEYAFYAEQKRMLLTLSHQAAVAIERAQLVEAIDNVTLQEESAQFKLSLLSSIAFRFKPAISAIMHAIGSVKQQGNAVKTQLEVVEEETEQLGHYTQSLLDIACNTVNVFEPQKKRLNIDDIFQSAALLLEKRLASVRLVIEVADSKVMLYVDSVLFEQVIVNLLENAWKYSPENGTITLSAYMDENAVIITCEDEGIAMQAEQREQLFDLVPSMGNDDGLALFICRGIVEAHNGTISATEGKNGQGTRIIIRLPA